MSAIFTCGSNKEEGILEFIYTMDTMMKYACNIEFSKIKMLNYSYASVV